MSEDYFIQAMLDYKDGERFATVMDRIARGYTRAQIEAMAEFLAQRNYSPPHVRASWNPVWRQRRHR